ncbi:MAG: bifunctional oligoribonuclease/PAP phosphatase NrnA [Elusimicrobiota bacterium]|nr:bifunctional oligoribonuclease/PAP phosphatase NrnA [Elusimicrobiota bacterium]
MKIKQVVGNILDFIKNSQSVFITGHIRPDGDTVGSALALALWLKSQNKKVTVVTPEPIPEFLMFLPEASRIVLPGQLKQKKFHLGIILECPDEIRSGDALKGINLNSIVNIDHHEVCRSHWLAQRIIPAGIKPCTTAFVTHITLVDSRASSTAELVYLIMKHAGHKPTLNEAICLYTGIVTDTGKFQQANTTPQSLEIASQLLKAGVDPVDIYRNVYGKKPYRAVKLLGLVLNTLTVDENISYLKITKDMYKKTGAKHEDTDGFVNYAGLLSDVKVFCIFDELPDKKNTIKVSLRSYGNIDMTNIASEFGGGGHSHAAGFQLTGKIDNVIRNVITTVKEKIHSLK